MNSIIRNSGSWFAVALLAIVVGTMSVQIAFAEGGAGKIRARGAAVAAAKRGPGTINGTVKRCWLIMCTGTTGMCYAYNDMGGGIHLEESGKMERTLVDCPKGAHGFRVTRFFAFDPNDPAHEMGYGWTNCDAAVDGPNALLTEFEETQLQTSFTEWRNAP